MTRSEPAPPATDVAQHVEVLGELGAEQACSWCALQSGLGVRPGHLQCEECSGTGRIARAEGTTLGIVTGGIADVALDPLGVRCPACSGDKVVPCSACATTGRTSRARVIDVTDTPCVFDYTYVPPMRSALETSLETALRATPPPECLRLSKDSSAIELHGFAFDDRLDRVRNALRRAGEGGTVVRESVDIHAWPVLVVKSNHGSGAQAAFFVDGAGKIHALVDEG